MEWHDIPYQYLPVDKDDKASHFAAVTKAVTAAKADVIVLARYMVRLGKDIEKTVLARGLRYHLEDRVLVHGNKTIVFA